MIEMGDMHAPDTRLGACKKERTFTLSH